MRKDADYYIVKGVRYPRVTRVCAIVDRPGLDSWKVRVGAQEAERVLAETGEYGTRVHEITMWDDRKNERMVEILLTVSPWTLPHLLAWREWVGVMVKRWIVVERTIISTRLGCAGTIDRVAILRGDTAPSIIDIKTGSLHDDIGTQLAAYRMMYNERAKVRAKRIIAVALPRVDPGKLAVKEFVGKKYDERFKAALKLYKSVYRGR